MFELPVIQIAQTDRSRLAKILAEGVARFALVFAIFGAIRHASRAVPIAVANHCRGLLVDGVDQLRQSGHVWGRCWPQGRV